MAEVVLFHHVHGLTPGVTAFGASLRAGGHTVHTPDLYEGELTATLEAGMAHLRSIGEDVVQQRVDRALEGLPDALVYAGFSWGAATAQELAQTRPGARGAVLFDACMPITGEWAIGPWPEGLPVQVHGLDGDPFFALEGDIDAARELVASVGPELGELFVYPGEVHLFADSSLPSYDPEAAGLALERTLAFLDRVG